MTEARWSCQNCGHNWTFHEVERLDRSRGCKRRREQRRECPCDGFISDPVTLAQLHDHQDIALATDNVRRDSSGGGE